MTRCSIFGRKPTLCVAMGLFMIGSLGAGLSRSIIELIIFRGTCLSPCLETHLTVYGTGVGGAGGGGIITLAQARLYDSYSHSSATELLLI